MTLPLNSCAVSLTRRFARRGALVVASTVASLAAFQSVATPAAFAQATPTTFDRTKPPVVPPAKPLTFPTAQQRTLKNGTPVVILEDHHTPVVSVVAIIDIPGSLDPAGKTGLGGMTSGMLGEGTTTHSADQLSDLFAELGNRVSPTGFYTITANADRSLDLMAEQLLHPAFPEASLTRIKANTAARIRQAKESPGYLAGRVLSKVLYGPNHPYSRTPSEEETMSITRDDVVHFYDTYFRPPNVKFVVAGDLTPDQAVEKLERVFGTWASGTKAERQIPVPPGVDSTRIYLYDRPNSPQSIVLAAGLGPRRDTPDYYAIELMSTIFGGAFNSRLNLNLREQRHYAYGAQGGFSFRRVPEVSTFSAGAAVATPKTDSALIETLKEIRGIRGDVPVTSAEFAFAKTSETAKMPLEFETIGARATAVAGLVANNLPLDYYNTVISKYNAVTQEEVQQAAAKYIDPSKLAIIVVGDRAKVEAGLRAAKIAPVVIVDPL